jgi:hypothetical protein
MKKFTESMEDSGMRDKDGTWIPETPQAKLRNKLSPFWTLSEILSNDDHFDMIVIYNTQGKLIMEFKSHDKNIIRNKIDHLVAGVYLVSFVSNNKLFLCIRSK